MPHFSTLSRRTALGAAATAGLGTALHSTASAGAESVESAPAEGNRAGQQGPARRHPHRPNIILVSIDDLGWDELGCYGNTFNETPRIDALAADGTKFTNAYAAAPVCSPNRAAMMTGRFPIRTGVTDFLRQEPAPSDRHLSTDIPTVPDLLKPLGYTTGLIGKWHLTETYSGPYEQRPGNPFAHGFDEVLVSEQRYIANGDYFHPYFFMPDLPAREPGEHLTDRLATEAVEFIERHRDEPFFVHVSNYATHTTLEGKPDLVAKYQAKPGAGEAPNRPQLAAMLQSIDEQVGRIADTLDGLGIAEDTLLLVTSDNGGAYRDANLPLRGGKGDLYEGGIRVPLVAHWPGRSRPGRIDGTLTSAVDILPTAFDLAGGRGHTRDFDGTSIAAAVTGHGRVKRDTLFWVYPHFIGSSHPQAAVRKGDLKLVQHLRDGRTELFHIGRDPAEKNDLTTKEPGRSRELRALLARHLDEVDLFPPEPSSKAYRKVELDESFDGDLSGWDVLAVPPGSTTADVTIDAGRAIVTTEALSHVLLRSRVAPRSDEFSLVLDPGRFTNGPGQDTVFVGLAKDADNYLLLRYHHGLHRVGWDLRVDGRLITEGAEPWNRLDGTVDLSSPDARLAVVLRGSVPTAYVDQGNGWEFLFNADIAGALDLSDPGVRRDYRYAASVRLTRGTITLDGVSARRR